MNAIIALNKDIAEALWGWRPGRPTISQRTGEVIADATGMSPVMGRHLFHGALGLVALGLLAGVAKAVSSKQR